MRTEKTKEERLLDQYIAQPPLIQWIEERLENDGRLGINIGIQEGLILKGLCTPSTVEKVVEIGTQYGCSASWMAMGLGSRGQLYTLEQDSECIKNSQQTFQHPDFRALGCHVELLEGAALENLPRLSSKGPFDLVFIDANKSAYLDYLHWAKQNLADLGMIVIDNVYLFGSVFYAECPPETPKKMWEVMKQVLAEQLQDPCYSTAMIPTPEGLLISHKIPTP
jgi:predicted O-methyltransferase YrrM